MDLRIRVPALGEVPALVGLRMQPSVSSPAICPCSLLQLHKQPNGTNTLHGAAQVHPHRRVVLHVVLYKCCVAQMHAYVRTPSLHAGCTE